MKMGLKQKLEACTVAEDVPAKQELIEKKESTLRTVTCKKCGKAFKTNRNTNFCWKCEKQ